MALALALALNFLRVDGPYAHCVLRAQTLGARFGERMLVIFAAWYSLAESTASWHAKRP